jgi:hypothetical protein
LFVSLSVPDSKIKNPTSKIENKPAGKFLSRQLIPFDLVVAAHNRFGSLGTTLGYDHAFLRFLLFNQTFHLK